ncbi:hypothetical protein FB45DRAFT_999999 [Roridomyces roridus]|uniref:F-box domain-containing protein n=1 Tax=Roridomyces roridus TaxID=1738132 RepID=A0AAD7C7H5_9AGAR|nr:hypothetical protein FB45DRAFT_999999 [Roridomyces roridus]
MSIARPLERQIVPGARIVAIDAEICELEERLRVLQTERETRQQRLDAYKYPVLTLPNEITSEIFVHFLPLYPECPPLRGLDSPTALTHICRGWREMALANPMLWRALSIGYAARTEQAQSVVQTWLDRSGSCPLSINLERDYPGATTRKELLTATLLHRERWQHVRLDLRAAEVALIEGPLPLLESLDLAVDELAYMYPAASASDLPRLRSVTLDDADHGNWLPLSQLTILTLNRVYENNYLPILRCGELGSSVHPSRTSWPSVVIDRWTFGSDHVNSVASLISRSGCKLQQVLFTARTSEVSEESLRAALPSISKVAVDPEYDWYSEASRGFKNGLGL